jgi:hypothetical protein
MEAIQGLGAAVTPAVMLSACGLVALGLDHQVARVAARLRELSREPRAPVGPGADHDAARLRRLGDRHRLLAHALFLDYAAMTAFVGTSLLALLQAYLPVPQSALLALFTLGVALLAAMSGLAAASTWLRRAGGRPLVPRGGLGPAAQR